MFDVVVVGARCAGAPTAMLFGRAGYRVLLVDRCRFPSDRLSTLYIQPPGVALLARWGLLEAVRASGCPPLDRVVYQLDDVRLEGCARPIEGARAAFAPRRYLLDAILVDAAVRAGAEFRDGCTLVDLVRDTDGRVAGVELLAPRAGGRRRRVTERARLVVGADGMRSAVARLAGARKTVADPRLTCAYYTLWEGPVTAFEMYEGPTGWVSAVPTNDATLISGYYPQQQFSEVRTRATAAYFDNVRTNAPALYEQLAGATQVEPLRGTGDQQNFFRQASGPGWVLLGDAGHHKDSLTARGIGDAFMQAQLLTYHVGDDLHDPARLDRSLRSFGEDRDQVLMDGYRATLLVAQAGARDQRLALLRVVGASPDLTQRYFDTVAGIRPVTELYTPELLAMLA